MFRNSLAAGLAVTLRMVSPLHAQNAADVSVQLETTLEQFQSRYGFPGATAAIALPDGTIVAAAIGLADIESTSIMTPQTKMLAASIGKTFVASTVLALESEGLLSRADLLSTHLGDRAWFGALPNASTIIIDHLLHHTAGLPDHVHLPAFQQAWSRRTTVEGEFDPVHLVAFLVGQDPSFEAGNAWAYSDTGYVLLGLVIEDVTGGPWREAVRVRFLDPLSLSRTIASDRPDLPELAVGYVVADNPFGIPERTADPDGRLLWNPAVESAGGGFATTSADLARWGHLLFGGEAMRRPYLDRLLDGVPVDPDAPDILYGAGIAIYADTAHGPVWGHGGWIPGYVSSLRHYADHGVTVAFQINTDASVMEGSSDLVPALEDALAELAINAYSE
ncbi:MAG: serine hydrolase domain-containing protein [Pseudohongiella sp.]|nr:serine hydrolase domain-containing protein [Pseudohongiella sp.]